jgi:hypothetical protein
MGTKKPRTSIITGHSMPERSNGRTETVEVDISNK